MSAEGIMVQTYEFFPVYPFRIAREWLSYPSYCCANYIQVKVPALLSMVLVLFLYKLLVLATFAQDPP